MEAIENPFASGRRHAETVVRYGRSHGLMLRFSEIAMRAPGSFGG